MLALLGEGTEAVRRTSPAASATPTTSRRLWYLRGDLMAALAAIQGEAAAREKVAGITRMFQGLLPGSLNSRPSPLVG